MAEEKDLIREKYKQKGAQQLSMAEYEELQKKTKKANLSLAAPAKIVLTSPLLLIFCFGVFFLPYMMYTAFTAPESPIQTEEAIAEDVSYSQFLKKKP